MIKLIYNFIFIILIFIIATAIPLSFDLIQFRLSNATPQIDLPHETFDEEDILKDALELTLKSIEAETFTLHYESNIPLTVELIGDYFVLKLKGERGNVFELPLSAEQFNPLTKTINFESSISDLPEDFYRVSLESLHHDYEVLALDHLMLSLYSTHYTYSPFKGSTPSNRRLFTLYFPSENFDYLVPVSAHLPLENNRWRTAYHALMNGSIDGYPLAQNNWLPNSSNIQWLNSEVIIHWDHPPREKNAEEVEIIQKAIAQTFFSFEAPYDSSAVIFRVRGNADHTLEKSQNPSIFLPHLNENNSIFFVPFEMPRLESEEEQIQAIWDTLAFQTDEWISYESMPRQVIYPKVGYEELEIKDQMLTVNLDPSSLEAYQDHPLDFKLMIDALVHSFTSIQGIERVQFLSSGEFIDESWYEGISSPLEPSILNFISF